VKEKDTQEELSDNVESRRIVIQGVLNKGEEGLSSKDQIQRRRVQRCNKRRKPNSKKSKDMFMGRSYNNKFVLWEGRTTTTHPTPSHIGQS
jgi:hypothetical protein